MCICYKFSAKYNRWWTVFFHVHCFACFLCLISLLFFGRLVFDDLDKRQFIHLGIHIAIVASLITLLAGNRCSLPRLYFVYFIGYHLLLITNIGLEVYTYYTIPHHINRPLIDAKTSNETLITTTTPAPINITRFPNGQTSPYINMQEEALYALILVCLIVQAYFTLVIYGSYTYLIDKSTKIHTVESVVVKPKNSTSDLSGSRVSSQPQVHDVTIEVENKTESKWDKRFKTVGVILSCVMKIIPKK